MPIEEVLKSEGACCERIKDLEVEDHEQACQDFIFQDKSPLIYKEEQGKHHCNEDAYDSEYIKKIE